MTVEIVASIVTVLVTAGIGYAIAHKIVSRSRVAEAYKYAVWGVSAAEEMFAEGNGQIKFEYVRDLLLKRFGISEEDARMLVNAAVQGLRNAGFKPPVQPAAQAAAVVPIKPDAA